MSKKSKEKKDLSIPHMPDVLFVVELNEYILLTGFPIAECIFPYYKFEKDHERAFEAAEKIAVEQNKSVVNAVDFYIDDPMIYNPIEVQDQIRNLMDILGAERKKIIEAHKKLDEKKKSKMRPFNYILMSEGENIV